MYSLRHIRQIGARAHGIGPAFALLAAGFSASANAGEWTITPSVEVEQSVTDNARSVSEGQEADLITTTTAGIDIAGEGRRAQLNLNVDLSRDDFWDNTELGGLRQALIGRGNIEAVEDLVFIDTRASVNQRSLARGGTTTATNRTTNSADQTTIVNYSITPNFGHRYGNWAETDLRYTFNETRFLDTDVGEAGEQPDASRSHKILGLLRSGPRFTKFRWNLTSTRTFTDNGSDRDVMEASGEYAWTRKISLLGSLGREELENSGLNEDDSAEYFGRGGFRLTPGPRTTIRFEAGQRFGGINFSGDASYRIGSSTVIRASYEEEVRTDRQALTANLNNTVVGPDGTLIDPNTNLPASPNDSELDFLDQTTRQQNFNISLSGTSGRNTFTISGRGNIRTQEPDGTSDTVVTIGGTLNRRIWPRLNGGVGTSISVVTEAANGIEDYTLRSNAFLTYTFMEDLFGSLRYNFLRRDSDSDSSDLQENTLSISLRKTF